MHIKELTHLLCVECVSVPSANTSQSLLQSCLYANELSMLLLLQGFTVLTSTSPVDKLASHLSKWDTIGHNKSLINLEGHDAAL